MRDKQKNSYEKRDYKTMIGLDLETWGELPEYALQAHRAQKGRAGISAISISDGTMAIGSLSPTTEIITKLLRHYEGKEIVCWNTTFDVSWLYAIGVDSELLSSIKWYDAMLVWMHLTREPEKDNGPRKSYSLKAAMKEFYPDNADFKDFEDFQTTSAEGLKQLLHRNKEDAKYTVKLFNAFWARLSDKQRQAVKIEARCIPMVALTYVRGLCIDSDALRTLRTTLEADAVKAYQELKAHYPEIDRVNLGSPKQLGELLFTTWGLHPPKITSKGANSTDKFALHALAETYPQARLLRDYRESQNNLAKYVVAKEESLEYNGDGRSRPQAKIFGTYTSRVTYYSKQGKGKDERPTGFALHQEKRGSAFRNTIIPPPGYTLVELDFAGQEFGLMAVASGDITMLSLREDGEDAHSYMGAQIAKVDYRELIRLVKAGDKDAAYKRKLGKFCIAEGELVLTDVGLVPIEKVSKKMQVWDGVEWVHHDGVIFMGTKDVITYDGLTATPDHQVFVRGGKKIRFDQAKREKVRLTVIGPDWPYKKGSFIEPRFARVYDIANAGSRHRFTVSGRLVANCNLSFQYRISAKAATVKAKVEYGLDLDERFMQSILNTYKSSYPDVPMYWHRSICNGRKNEYAETFAGRRINLKGDWLSKATSWALESTAINYPIQGTGGDQKYLALAVARNILPQMGGYFYYDLHDGLYFILPDATATRDGLRLQNLLSNLPYKQAWGWEPGISFPVDLKMGKSWGQLREVER